jgi:hypothetical protein
MARDAQGRWLPGPDPDRHTLTRAERRKGYQAALRKCHAMDDGWGAGAWLYYRVRGWYRARRREAPAGGECPF